MLFWNHMETCFSEKVIFLFPATIICQPSFPLFSTIIPPLSLKAPLPMAFIKILLLPLFSLSNPPHTDIFLFTCEHMKQPNDLAASHGEAASISSPDLGIHIFNPSFCQQHVPCLVPQAHGQVPTPGAGSDGQEAASANPTHCPWMFPAYQHRLCSWERKPAFSINHSLSSAGYSSLHVSANNISVFLHPLPMFLLFVKLSSICSGI